MGFVGILRGYPELTITFIQGSLESKPPTYTTNWPFRYNKQWSIIPYAQNNLCFTCYIPSRELTYPLLKALLKMIFLFPRWDMLVPWRVYSWCLNHAFPFTLLHLQVTFASSRFSLLSEAKLCMVYEPNPSGGIRPTTPSYIGIVMGSSRDPVMNQPVKWNVISVLNVSQVIPHWRFFEFWRLIYCPFDSIWSIQVPCWR